MSAAPPGAIRRIVYLGTPGLAVPPLRALVDAGYEIPLVVSRADARRGRGAQRLPSPVKAAALELGLPVTDRLVDLDEVEADLAVVVAYGHLIPAAMLDRLAFVNLHFSLLPRWRGAAPVERAILAGDTTTGVCLMDLDIELDTGAVYCRTETPIGDDETLVKFYSRAGPAFAKAAGQDLEILVPKSTLDATVRGAIVKAIAGAVDASTAA